MGVKKQQWETAVAQILAGMAEMRGFKEYLYAGIDFGTNAAAASIEQTAVDAEARKKELAEAQKLSQSVHHPVPPPPPPPTPPPSYPPTLNPPLGQRGTPSQAGSSGSVLALQSTAAVPALSATALALRKPASQRTDEEVLAAAEGGAPQQGRSRVGRSRSPHCGEHLPEGYEDF